jgi:hypothetical protein
MRFGRRKGDRVTDQFTALHPDCLRREKLAEHKLNTQPQKIINVNRYLGTLQFPPSSVHESEGEKRLRREGRKVEKTSRGQPPSTGEPRA